MRMNDHEVHGRAAHGLSSLEEGGELARRRVWTKVQRGIALDRQRRRRRAGFASGAGALVAALAVGFVMVWQPFSSADSDGTKAVSVDAVWEMLSSQPGATEEHGSLDEFVLSIAGEAQTGAQ